jgi:hypothetical protein
MIDPRMHQQVQEHFPSRVTIQQITYTRSGANQKIPSGATDIAGLVGLPCRLGPIILLRPTDNEMRTQSVTSGIENRQCKINGYYPQITNKEMQAVVDGVTFPIRGVESDSNNFSTRMRLEIIKL